MVYPIYLRKVMIRLKVFLKDNKIIAFTTKKKIFKKYREIRDAEYDKIIDIHEEDANEIFKVDAYNSDFSKVPSFKFNPHAKFIYLCFTTGLSGNLDFGKVSSLYLSGANLYRVTGINFNPNGVISALTEKSCNEWTARFMAAKKNNTIAMLPTGRTK